jgi:medium-chain acyl-[acyl-carrier-protein] hydrolase
MMSKERAEGGIANKAPPGGSQPHDYAARRKCGSAPPPDAVRLLCFSHAGAGASVFAAWRGQFGAGIDIHPVQYPGRETRWAEPRYSDMAALVQSLADDLSGLWQEPCALLGHSFGALVAYELACVLQARGHTPRRLFLSGARAPQLPPREPIHALADADFVAKVLEFGGFEDEVLHNTELMQLVLPIVRADFRALETHRYTTWAPLPVPISVFGGLADHTVPVGDLLAWSEVTSKAFRSRFFPGGHFFLYREVAAIAGHVAADLAASAPGGAAGGARHAQ